MDCITELSSNPKSVVIFSKSSCCMCHSIISLFYGLGARPVIHELDNIPRGKEIESALMELGCSPAVPAVFIDGKFVGSANTIMTLQLNGSLKDMLGPK